MDNNEHDKITAFDTLFTTNHIQMLKIVMSYFDNHIQKQLAVYIKYLEFQYALSYSRTHSVDICGCDATKKELNIAKMCAEILPFCTNEEKQKMEQISGLFRSMEMYKEMSQTMEMMKELFPEGFGESAPFDIPFSNAQEGSTDGAGSQNPLDGNMMDLLMNMLSPEQKTMFEMFGGNNNESK